MDADLILVNGVVYTVDAERSQHEALAVREGRIIAVGTAAQISRHRGRQTQTVDLGGRLVLPGFVDAHAHPRDTVGEVFEVGLADCHSVRDCLDAVARFVAEHPGCAVVRGYGWHPTKVPEDEMTATALDSVAADRLVSLCDDSFHSQWVNTATLRLAGEGSPGWGDGAVIERAPDGTPTGLLREAWPWAERALPGYDVNARMAALLHFQRAIAARYGLTTVHEAQARAGDPLLDAYRRLDEQGELTVRFRVSLELQPDQPLVEQLTAAGEERARQTGPLVRVSAVKLFVDGVIEAHTGYLAAPYVDCPDMNGTPIWHPERLVSASGWAAACGFQLHYHAIGDAAVALALDSVAAARRWPSTAPSRDIITHLQLVDPRDYDRMRTLGVVAATQPYWFAKDADYDRDIYRPYLGARRAAHQYPMKSLFDHGITVAAASDYPVSPPPNPLLAIQRGVLRRDPTCPKTSSALWSAEAVTVEQMVAAFTINGAYANFLEGEIGSLEVGKSADLVVMSDDILRMEPERLHEAEVELTLFRGRPVFAAGAFAGLAAD